jgi:CHASE2 domain-containing sensor protein/signal transduction histidine kinase
MKLRLRLAVEWLAIGLLATAIVVLALLWRGTSSFDNLIYDQLNAAARPSADRDILMVAIDDPSLAALGNWPWDRATHARLIAKLQAKKPKSITLDILLSEASSADADAALAKSMAMGPAPVFIPLHFSTPGSDGRAFDTIFPITAFAGSASGVGHVNVIFDNDGIVRRTALCFRPDGERASWPHLIERAYRGTAGKPSPAINRAPDCGQELLIPYARRGSFAEISYADLLTGEVPADLIAGHDVIIGATAAGMRDNFPTPNGEGGLLSGAEIMANMLGAIRRDDFIEPLGLASSLALSLLPLWLLLVGFLRWRPRVMLVMSLLSIAAILAISAGFLTMRMWFAPGGALLGVLLVYPLWGWRRLQAMSDFMGSELSALEKEGEALPLPVIQSRATDVVGRQSEALAVAIDHMRDLRRFVADTLADLPDPMFVTDPEGTVTLTNRLLDERLDQSISGMPISEALLKMVAVNDRPIVDKYLQRTQAANENEHSPEFVRFLSPLGRTFVMRKSEVRSDAGVLHGNIHYLTDITALARAEAEREEVLQLLSHDMRAPQSTIIALLDGDIDADAKKRIERNARRTMQLAQDFVEIARMAETEFAGEDVLLADLVREAADNLWPLAKERGIHFAFGDASNSAFVLAEPDSLSRAVANLLDNAIKFSPDNGTIDIAIARRADGPRANIIVTITDQGDGIAADILPNLFTRFKTGGDQKGRVKGTGLGLTFVQAVIERHHGTISAHNNPTRGASFVIEIPQAPEA